MSDLNELEQTLLFSNSDTLMGIHKSAYTEMNLDNIDDSYISHNKGGADLPHDHHQADIDNITMCDKFDPYHANPNLFNQFERFDIESDDIGGTGEKFPSHTHTDPPPENFVPSPPLQDVPQKPNEIPEQHPGGQVNPQSDEDKHMGSIGSIKIARLMDLPPVSLVCGLVTNGTPDIYYPLPLLQQWMKITGSVHDSPSGGASPPHPPAPSSSSPPHPPAPSSSSPPTPPVTNNYDEPTTVPFEDNHSGAASGSSVPSIHKFRAERDVHPPRIRKVMDGLSQRKP